MTEEHKYCHSKPHPSHCGTHSVHSRSRCTDFDSFEIFYFNLDIGERESKFFERRGGDREHFIGE